MNVSTDSAKALPFKGRGLGGDGVSVQTRRNTIPLPASPLKGEE
jgi:hypothetical protein